MNSLFDGLQVPSAKNALTVPEHAEEVCLTFLLKNIDLLQLDLLRKCLVIDGQLRSSAKELLDHPYFDAEFKSMFDV